ncbi:hypothetical protein [Shimia haliotis]|uniref:Uncharacterized protein n=1 Tax=Shimia haliotis TaxID=1280847 RepID=A0A1I4CG04_9RHOB|nr:hypothetical protein [Shimia haliotis]SFK78911.1 hypothetical protein SAMN04488036_102193 [Shimia haliotis]
MTHDIFSPHAGRGPAASLASAWNALCCLPATHAWFWLARSGPVEAAPAIGLVLLDALPRLVDAFGAGAVCHG